MARTAKKTRPYFVWAKDLKAGDRITYSTTEPAGKAGHSMRQQTVVVKKSMHSGIGNYPIKVDFTDGNSEQFTEYSYIQIEIKP